MVALLYHGATHVEGVEIDAARVAEGQESLRALGLEQVSNLQHTPDTANLPFENESFDFVLSNAVFEHIPQPRTPYLEEVWRVLRPGGYVMLNETPNKYFPKEKHTTGLWCNHWLPREMALQRALRNGRYSEPIEHWPSSGWRGVGYYEIVKGFPGAMLIPEETRMRHRLLSAVGIPASILDPYPTWVFQKPTPISKGLTL